MNYDESLAHGLLHERDEEVRKIHKRILNESGINKKYLTRAFIIQQVQKSSAPRFYIEPQHAREYVKAYHRGKMTHMQKRKQEMVMDLAEVFESVRSTHVNYPMNEIWQMVVEHPAKSFYLSPARIIEIIYEYHDRKRTRKSAVS